MRLLKTSAATAAALLLVTSACKKAPEPVEAPAPPSAATAPVSVTSVDLGRAIGPDKRVVASIDDFGTRDTIYASVNTSGVATGATLTAKWTFEGGPEKVTIDSTTLSISPSGPAVTELHILNTSAWPTGKYKVAILLNGAQVAEKEFEVKK